MKYIDLNFPSPAENLACDESLLDACEDGALGVHPSGCPHGLLRFWEPQYPFVVVGYANQTAHEVNLDACQADHIPIFRRCTGGGTVLQAPGCLNYTLILKIDAIPELRTINQTNQFILNRHQSALQSLIQVENSQKNFHTETLNRENVHSSPSPPPGERAGVRGRTENTLRVHGDIRIQGCSDLTLNNLKFSGNAQRRKRHFLIFHGTFLLNMDLVLIEKYLRMPSKQPDYRHQRPHSSFLTNLNIPGAQIKFVLRHAWQAEQPLENLSLPQLPDLTKKYSTNDWNFKF